MLESALGNTEEGVKKAELVREKSDSDAVATKALNDPKESSGSGMALQGCPEIRQWSWAFVCSNSWVIGCERPGGRLINLDEAALFS